MKLNVNYQNYSFQIKNNFLKLFKKANIYNKLASVEFQNNKTAK